MLTPTVESQGPGPRSQCHTSLFLITADTTSYPLVGLPSAKPNKHFALKTFVVARFMAKYQIWYMPSSGGSWASRISDLTFGAFRDKFPRILALF